MVVVPGMIFKRTYFAGEFSKQFRTRDNVYNLIFYGIIPGVIIQLFSGLIYYSCHESTISPKEIVAIFKQIMNENENHTIATENFLKYDSIRFFIHIFNSWVLAGFLGFFLFRLIRIARLDRKVKFLRFSNQWYYIFSGEIFSFEKFKKAGKLKLTSKGEVNPYKSFPPYADVLVKAVNQSDLYSGYVIDYDLKADDVNELDKLYLFDAYKYEFKTSEILAESSIIWKEKKPIPGDVFILEAENILNINLTFIPDTRVKTLNKKSIKTLVYWLVYIFASVLSVGLFLDVFRLLLLPDLNSPLDILTSFTDSIVLKMMSLFAAYEFLMGISPDLIERTRNNVESVKLTYRFKPFLIRLLISAITIAIVYTFATCL